MRRLAFLRAIASAPAKLCTAIVAGMRVASRTFGSALPDLLVLAGTAGIGLGLWWIYKPAAPLVLGVMALVAGLLMARGEPHT